MKTSLAAGALASLATLAAAVNPVKIAGSQFVDSVTNKRVMIIGVDYQPGGQAGYKPDEDRDPLSDAEVCLRDATIMQQLGINTIRVYNVDPTLNHDECASIFNYAGMYMIVDVNAPFGGESLDRSDPEGSYHVGYLSRTFGVVEAFKNYPNTMGFFAANEVMNDMDTAEKNPQYIRAIQRDIKNYIAKNSERAIPVGYSAADVRPILQDSWAYFQCKIGDNDVSRSDFFGLNSYSWCGADATFESAGFDKLATMFEKTSVPVFFSEYGCNEVTPRSFNEVQSLYGTKLTALSGGLVYEYSQEESNYGLVDSFDNGTVHFRIDYDNLKNQYSKLDIGLIQSTSPSAASQDPPQCDKSLITNSKFSSEFNIPDTPDEITEVINSGLSNPNQGKLVPVTKTDVVGDIFAVDWTPIQGLKLVEVKDGESNLPSGASGSGTGTSGGPEPTKTGAASAMTVNSMFALVAAAVVLVVSL
ncbi:hypothetical protein P152DRAFT_408038 [Eremomyces bilateralis CBS 781.70]|uniref:1,3-beta-glucanosyltransferase n=1 Tax=Eremomyces bilateralis CBS 781.70 TaxID=1392243 RepID=A0A6G1GH95_9PEZI|nr:uncharacterized protein P152DRAFT_408038 [Eremomyces bilateralis CBS 781.70]KAF1817423.1 hypothetical protein P152DRAFT_408038 [Eremomyces bilateralis CBS 781.70]